MNMWFGIGADEGENPTKSSKQGKLKPRIQRRRTPLLPPSSHTQNTQRVHLGHRAKKIRHLPCLTFDDSQLGIRYQKLFLSKDVASHVQRTICRNTNASEYINVFSRCQEIFVVFCAWSEVGKVTVPLRFEK